MTLKHSQLLPEGWRRCPICNELIVEGTVWALASHLRVEENMLVCPCRNNGQLIRSISSEIATSINLWIEHFEKLMAKDETLLVHLTLEAWNR